MLLYVYKSFNNGYLVRPVAKLGRVGGFARILRVGNFGIYDHILHFYEYTHKDIFAIQFKICLQYQSFIFLSFGIQQIKILKSRMRLSFFLIIF